MDYEDHLRRLKSSFVGGGEGGFYLRSLDLVARRRHLDWLDIGIGRDGSALQTFVRHCRKRGQTLAITGVDPDADPKDRQEDGVSWRLIRKTFQDWSDGGRFDVINADQSLYYLGDMGAVLRRVGVLLRPGGLFIATCWSRDDVIHRLKARLFAGADHDLVAEDLEVLVRDLPEFSAVVTENFKAAVHLDTWRDNPHVLASALRVIARRPLDPLVDPGPDMLRAALDGFPDSAPRLNMALCAVRGPS